MSILIEGMDMPKGCFYDEPPYHCPFYDCLKCTRLNTYGPARPYKYLPNCPLVEVPAPHGRLIDVSKVRRAVFAEEDNVTGMGMTLDEMDGYNNGIAEMYRLIQTAPTVIEAEGEDR